VGKGGEGGDLRALDGGEEGVEPTRGLGAIGGRVDRSKRLLEPPRPGDDRLALEELEEPAPVAL
jgi:hypothetical protein